MPLFKYSPRVWESPLIKEKGRKHGKGSQGRTRDLQNLFSLSRKNTHLVITLVRLNKCYPLPFEAVSFNPSQLFSLKKKQKQELFLCTIPIFVCHVAVSLPLILQTVSESRFNAALKALEITSLLNFSEAHEVLTSLSFSQGRAYGLGQM